MTSKTAIQIVGLSSFHLATSLRNKSILLPRARANNILKEISESKVFLLSDRCPVEPATCFDHSQLKIGNLQGP